MYKELEIFIESLSTENKEYLSQQLNNWGGAKASSICGHIHYLRYGELGQFNPFAERNYKQIVTDVADHVEIDWPTLLNKKNWYELNSSEIEDAIVKSLFIQIWNKISVKKRNEIIEKLSREEKKPNLKFLLGSGSGIIAANLSGFQLYILSSTLLSSLSSTLGMTFPFAMYTGLSKGIAVVIGPVGWSALGLATIFQLSRPKWSKLIQSILIISHLRNKNSRV